MSDKIDVRLQLKKVRADFPGERRESADAAISDIFLKAYGGLQSYFIYNSFSSEADTKHIINSLLSSGKRVYIPRVEGEDIVAVPFGNMRRGAFGIEEPEGQAYFGDTDITVIPLLGINSRLFRIGYGKGFYDRYLRDRHTVKVGLGYSFQRAEFKEDEWDIPLDAFICEKGIFK